MADAPPPPPSEPAAPAVSSVVAEVGDTTVGAKSPAWVMLDAALVAVAVVNCLVIVAAASLGVAGVGVAAAAAPVWHLSYVVEGQTSSAEYERREKNKEIRQVLERASCQKQITIKNGI